MKVAPTGTSGLVKTWNIAKGYGFVTSDSGAEAFVHFTQVKGSGLEPGRRVYYEEQEVPGKRGEKQRTALDVHGEGVIPLPRARGAFKGVVMLWVTGRSMGLIRAVDGEEIHVHSSAFGGGSLAAGKEVWYDVRRETHVKNGKKIASNVSGPAVIRVGKLTGIVKAWIAHKGYGFAEMPDGSEVYVHRSALSDGHCQVGKEIFFSLQTQPNNSGRKQAANVTGPAVRPGSAVDFGPPILKGGKMGTAGKGGKYRGYSPFKGGSKKGGKGNGGPVGVKGSKGFKGGKEGGKKGGKGSKYMPDGVGNRGGRVGGKGWK
ncbi:hypothetical protein DIPPA_32261 [Diplonema papillatum]|nr:hypothetical protein DIPPA_32261 [Diplonema papillatum]